MFPYSCKKVHSFSKSSFSFITENLSDLFKSINVIFSQLSYFLAWNQPDFDKFMFHSTVMIHYEKPGGIPSYSFVIVCRPQDPFMITAVSISYEKCNTVTNYIEVCEINITNYTIVQIKGKR